MLMVKACMLANLTVIVGGGTFGDIGGQVAADQSGLLAPRLALSSTASRKVSTYSSMYNLQSTSICYFAMLVALLDTYSLPLVLLKTCQLLPCPCSCSRVFQLFFWFKMVFLQYLCWSGCKALLSSSVQGRRGRRREANIGHSGECITIMMVTSKTSQKKFSMKQFYHFCKCLFGSSFFCSLYFTI